MKRFRNILLLIGGKDGGKKAVARAAELAQRNSAKLTLVSVVDPLPRLTNVPNSEAEKSHNELVAEQLSKLGQTAEPLRAAGVATNFMVLEGSPAERIVSEVSNSGYDLVIKTAEEPEGAFRRLFGTTARRLLRNCPCPVWVIKATEEQRFAKILAAVDPRPLGQDRDPQNIKMLELATSIAGIDHSELHVVYVWPHWTDPPIVSEPAEDEDKTRQRSGETLQQRMLSALIKPYQDAGQIDHVHLRKGNPGQEIAKLAEELKVELLVMGTICSTSVKELFIGTTAERVLDQVDCSVLTVKPDDFVAAVRK